MLHSSILWSLNSRFAINHECCVLQQVSLQHLLGFELKVDLEIDDDVSEGRVSLQQMLEFELKNYIRLVGGDQNCKTSRAELPTCAEYEKQHKIPPPPSGYKITDAKGMGSLPLTRRPGRP